MPIAGSVKMLVRWSITLAVAGLAMAGLSACDAASPASGGARQVTVVGAGKVQGVPDTLTADVGIEFIAPDVTTAMNQTNERQQAVIAALKDAGVDETDIATTRVSLQPQYNADGGGAPTISGYRANNSLRVKIRELDSASEVLALIVGTGSDAIRINSVSYSIEDDSQLVRDARTRAFSDAKDRAEQYARLSGLRLGKVLSISETSGNEPPTPMPIQRAMADVPVEPGQQTVSFSVTAVWELT